MLRWDNDPEALAADLWTVAGPSAYTVVLDRPVYVGGAVNTHPGVWRLWGFATPEWPKIAVPLTKWVRRFMIPAVFKCGAHRCESHTLRGNDKVEGWLRLLGGQMESVMRGYGRGGEDVAVYAWKPCA
jgi:hypothetical protein